MKHYKDLSIEMTIGVIILIVVVLGATALIFFSEGFVRPAVLDLRRDANQQSQQYVETTQGRLFQLRRKYDDLQADITRLSGNEDNTQTIAGMVARQESLLDEMEYEALSIPESEVPESIKELLLENGRLQ